MRAVCTVLICFLAQGLFAQEGIEYWFGTDPGAGNGTFIAQGSGDGASLSTSGLPPGNHTVGIRVRDAEGFWSFPRAALLRIEEETPEAQTIEYFWDEDPGIGNAASLPVDAHLSVPTTGLDYGNHILGLRIQDALGRWSQTVSTPIEICTNYNVEATFNWDVFSSNVMLGSTSEHATEIFWSVDGDIVDSTANPTLTLTPGPHEIVNTVQNECDTASQSIAIELLGATSTFPSVATQGETIRLTAAGYFEGMTSFHLTDGDTTLVPDTVLSATDVDLVADFNIPVDLDSTAFDFCTQYDTGEEVCLETALIVSAPYSGFASEISGPGAIRNNVWTPFQVTFRNTGNLLQLGIPVTITVQGGVEARMEASTTVTPFQEVMADPDLEGNPFVETYLRDHFVRLPNPLTSGTDSLEFVALMLPFLAPGQAVTVNFEVRGQSGMPPMSITSKMGAAWYATNDLSILTAGGSDERTNCDFLPPCAQGLVDIAGMVPALGCVIAAGDIGCAIGNCFNDFLWAQAGFESNQTGTQMAVECVLNLAFSAIGVAMCGLPGSPSAVQGRDAIWNWAKSQILDAASAPMDAAEDAMLGLLMGSVTDPGGLFNNLCQCIPGGNCGDDDGQATMVASVDPNEKTGPLGYGEAHWLNADTDHFFYRVECENADSATAPAAQVIMVDTLDLSVYDASSVRFNHLFFAGQELDIQPAADHFIREVDLRPDKNTILRIEGTVDTTNGALVVDWQSLDPETRTLSFDIDAGFLNPNVTAPEGQAWVDFTIDLLPGANVHDALIANEADIYFDGNDPIATPLWSNRLDGVPPVASVSGFAAGDSTLSCIVDGQDDGSGVRYLDIHALSLSGDTLQSEYVGRFLAQDTVELDLDPTVEHHLVILGVDGTGNHETADFDVLTLELADGHYIPSSCTVDFDGDGSQGIGDLLFLLTQFGQVGDSVTDLNEDGVTAIADLLIFLPILGAPCN